MDLSQQFTAAGGPTFGQLGVAAGTEFAGRAPQGKRHGIRRTDRHRRPTDAGLERWRRFLSPLDFKYDDADATLHATFRPTWSSAEPCRHPFTAGTPIDAARWPRSSPAAARWSPRRRRREITHPAQIQAGVAYSGYKNWLLEADYAWVGYKRFDTLPVVVQR